MEESDDAVITEIKRLLEGTAWMHTTEALTRLRENVEPFIPPLESQAGA